VTNALVEQRPTLANVAKIDGMTSLMVSRYGKQIVEVIDNVCTSRPLTRDQPVKVQAIQMSQGKEIKPVSNTQQQSYDLFMGKGGQPKMTIAQVCTERTFKQGTIFNHLENCMDNGLAVDMDRLPQLPQDVSAEIARAAAAAGGPQAKMGLIKDRLPDDPKFGWDAIRLFQFHSKHGGGNGGSGGGAAAMAAEPAAAASSGFAPTSRNSNKRKLPSSISGGPKGAPQRTIDGSRAKLSAAAAQQRSASYQAAAPFRAKAAALVSDGSADSSVAVPPPVKQLRSDRAQQSKYEAAAESVRREQQSATSAHLEHKGVRRPQGVASPPAQAASSRLESQTQEQSGSTTEDQSMTEDSQASEGPDYGTVMAAVGRTMKTGGFDSATAASFMGCSVEHLNTVLESAAGNFEVYSKGNGAALRWYSM